jgi:hypothetical protein
VAQCHPLTLLTRKEKAWFFLSCGYLPKINEMIFLLILSELFHVFARLKVFSILNTGGAMPPAVR